MASKLPFGLILDCMMSESEYNLCGRPSLHLTSNVAGFNTRAANGRVSGANWVSQMLIDYPGLSSGSETIDVVAHSRGFAYAQGTIYDMIVL